MPVSLYRLSYPASCLYYGYYNNCLHVGFSSWSLEFSPRRLHVIHGGRTCTRQGFSTGILQSSPGSHLSKNRFKLIYYHPCTCDVRPDRQHIIRSFLIKLGALSLYQSLPFVGYFTIISVHRLYNAEW
jgi:hypothetical protein